MADFSRPVFSLYSHPGLSIPTFIVFVSSSVCSLNHPLSRCSKGPVTSCCLLLGVPLALHSHHIPNKPQHLPTNLFSHRSPTSGAAEHGWTFSWPCPSQVCKAYGPSTWPSEHPLTCPLLPFPQPHPVPLSPASFRPQTPLGTQPQSPPHPI